MTQRRIIMTTTDFGPDDLTQPPPALSYDIVAWLLRSSSGILLQIEVVYSWLIEDRSFLLLLLALASHALLR